MSNSPLRRSRLGCDGPERSEAAEAAATSYQDSDHAKHYAKDRFTGRRRLTDLRDKQALSEALSLLPREGLILDAPCGAGRMTKMLVSRGIDTIGSDVSFEMISEALDGGSSGPFVQADALALPFADETFSAVCSIRFLYHLAEVDERRRALSELARVSKRYVVVSMFDVFTWQGARRRLKAALGGKKPMRVAMSRRRFEREAAESGLMVLGYFPSLAGVSEHTLVLLEKVPSEETLRERRRRTDEFREETRTLHPALYFLASHEALLFLAAGAILTFLRWKEFDADAINWPCGLLLIVGGLFLRFRATSFATKGVGIGWMPTLDHLRVLGRDVALGWILVGVGLSLLSENIALVPIVLLLAVFRRRAVETVAVASPLTHPFAREARPVPGYARFHYAFAADYLFVASVTLSVIALSLKELLE